MKSKLLGFALIGFTIVVAACASDDDTPAAAVTPSPDIAEGDADAAQGDAVAPESDTTSDTASDTAGSADTVTLADAEVTDADVAAATDIAPETADTAPVDGTTADVAAGDAVEADTFEPGAEESACKLPGNPNESVFGSVEAQSEVLATAISDCYKQRNIQGEEFISCIRGMVMEAYGSTADCAQCFAVRADCIKTFCFGSCVTAQNGECDACQMENYCLHPFETCSGLSVF